jgi:hypothetical protein
MATGINTGVAFDDSLWPALDFSDLIVDPTLLFKKHKERVEADGGVIPDETGCLARFKLLVDNGMYENIAIALTPRFGLKLSADGTSVEKVYSLAGPDVISFSQAGGWLPQWDAAAGAVRVRVISTEAGYLKSESNVVVQVGDSYVINCVGSDSSGADNFGITLGAAIGNLPMAYCRIIKTATLDEAYRYGTRDSAFVNPSNAGGAVNIAKTPYAPYQPSAAFFDVNSGVVTPYGNGVAGEAATAATGALYAMRSANPVIIGNPAFTGATMQNCDGTFREFTILNAGSTDDAITLSRIR